jgi:uncharacterized membrane protein
MDARGLAVFAHIIAAFWFVAGYVGTNLCTEVARRATSAAEQDVALAFSGRFDRWLNAPGGTMVSLTGIIALLVFGYPLTAAWVVLSVALMAGVVLVGIFYWGRVGRRIEASVKSGDRADVDRLLRLRRNVLLSRIENLVVLAVIALMVFRPG